MAQGRFLQQTSRVPVARETQSSCSLAYVLALLAVGMVRKTVVLNSQHGPSLS